MTHQINVALIVAASLSAIASLLHVGIVFGGPSWYRFFGAGERMAAASAAGRTYPTVVTMTIAFILAIWSAYALAGAGVIAPLPFAKLALGLITATYLLRGLALIPLLLFARDKSTPFLVWSSLVCIIFGVTHLFGVKQAWPSL